MSGDLIKDKWTAADGTPWDSTIWSTVRNVRGTAPAPTTTGNMGHITTSGGAADSMIVCALGSTYADCDISFKWQAVTFGGTTPPNPGMYPQMSWRYNTNVDTGDLPRDGYGVTILPLRQRINLIRTFSSGVGGAGLSFDVLATVDLVPIDDTDPHWMRIRVKGSRMQVKWWHNEGDESITGYAIDVTDTVYATGRTLILMNNDDTGSVCHVAFDDFRFEELLPAEPGIILPQGATTAVNVGAVPVTACYIGPVNIPVP